jgi:anti-sigma regulatory factor (Ser/Thr protein kinase)
MSRSSRVPSLTGWPGYWTMTAHFSAHPTSVGAARRFVVSQLAEREITDPELLDGAALIVSELVTNALQAGSPDVGLTLHHLDGVVRVDVADTAPGRPVKRPMDPTSTHGRGLHLVEQLASGWGYERAGPGKYVWATMATPPPS